MKFWSSNKHGRYTQRVDDAATVRFPQMLGLSCALLVAMALTGSPLARADVAHYRAKVIEKVATERRNYVQGLEIDGNRLLISAGLYGDSAVRAYGWPSMELQQEQLLPRRFFAEGLTRVDDRIYLLTWRARTLLVLDAATLAPVGQAALPGEGWGITHHGSRIWFSDGSDRLFTTDTSTDEALQIIEVRRDGRPVYRLNELEWINGEIWANVYMTNEIVRIDPKSGVVTGVIDLTGLLAAEDRKPDTDVLNGIAHDPSTGAVWVTGKRWPWLFRIELEEH